MIPVSIVTGFLGSGKTTLISRVIRDASFGRVAVIVNEFGEIALDHDLIASSDDSVLTLNTGCLCCSVQTDLALTLMELLERRAAGSIKYDRVLVETSGLSDPTPLLQGMMGDEAVATAHRVPFVVALVDTLLGERNLTDHVEARHQVALADRLLFSKTDLRGPSDRLLAELDVLNGGSPRGATVEVGPCDLFGEPSVEALTARLVRTRHRRGHSGVDTFSVARDRPIPALAVTLLLQALSEHCGSRLLRIKGIVAIEEIPDRPMVVHGVGHVISPPAFLDRWPSEDRRSRIIVIASGVPRHFVSRLMDAIEEEVRDAAV